jgi:drug/metabolite transporter (DMT)-like permease
MFLPFAAYDLASLDPASVRPTTLAAIGYYGVVVTVLAFVLWFRGVSEVPARTAGAFTGVLPVSAVVLSYLLLGERFRLSHLIGIACVLSGILLVSSTE